ncbi:nitrate- and nitrite sensing domain-containing protein [Nocardia sp. NBC_01503]|uniref:sensor histidine kinase n=1 Tax=Nocardia sp. NBC_01503 TaxID=2975997 RepID=UPI002E7BBFFE|nr:nitrate- and nitrite sensing domain-containing protein [Nocardia sp. NBC_01503]WTL35799.1 nitrate- and nitrite sensing domain-containing protein [Nocardia sp. NBC_01503]
MGSWQNLRKSVGRQTNSVGRGVRGWVGIRVRLLSIVLISSVTLLAIGGGAAIYLVKSAQEAKQWAELASSTTTPAILMVSAFEEERRLSVLRLAGDTDAIAELIPARKHSDEALAVVISKGDAARELNPDGSASDIEAYNKLFEMVPTLRSGVDAMQAQPEQIFGFFTQVIGTIIAASMLAARVAPNAKIGIELGYAVEQLRAAEALSQADTIGAVALTTGEFPDAQLLEFGRRVGEFRSEVAYSATVLKGVRLDQLNAITAGAAWQQVTEMQDALLLRGPVSESADTAESSAEARDTKTAAEPAPLPVGLEEWQRASGQVNTALQRLWEDQSRDAHVTARHQGDDATRDSLLGGAVVLVIATLAFIAALVLANRFIGRMRRLRRDTLELADERLPGMIAALGAGKEIDAAAEVSRLDFGTDELGQVAAAFNRAHVVAVSAAVGEARTRAGINAVFLNIAHRSQVVVHRQLGLLDRAEREEKNSDQLELLFQLDHLATRARRNAENLIILGGEKPGRRWRNPVALIDLVRGAVAESLDYTRIQTGRLPEAWVSKHAVADVIHLLAELMDNATACSPPEAQVTVSAVVVGRGVAVEIIDQGLGMSEAEFAERNALLANPPDFSVATLSGDTRLGLFVVAKLAGRHGISVRLAESEYAGVCAVVLIPSAVLEAAGPPRHEMPAAPQGSPEPRNGLRHEWSNAVRTEQLPALPRPSLRTREPGPNALSASYAAGAESNPDRPGTYTDLAQSPQVRPDLPRRSRTAEAEAQAAAEPVAPAPPRKRTADEARNLMSAIAKGTRQGRAVRPESERGPQ